MSVHVNVEIKGQLWGAILSTIRVLGSKLRLSSQHL